MSFNELLDCLYGPIGTPMRDQYEQEMQNMIRTVRFIKRIKRKTNNVRFYNQELQFNY